MYLHLAYARDGLLGLCTFSSEVAAPLSPHDQAKIFTYISEQSDYYPRIMNT